jgi:hypothetical protein
VSNFAIANGNDKSSRESQKVLEREVQSVKRTAKLLLKSKKVP